ncbi:GntR family transcriptional regulator [Glutamicibacter halophytocola]|uniref:GntR family transcriptional regulator n=1 Tax=Glutamicibacter halophytocola TaxID=1933880 RepID=UPI001558EACE|nr:GntR family transcriptional regulator [Glutamicibacter halophytocola]NQD41237.1 GntR family transcriptional regulator [Glutamicibacter halophytocola]
MRASDKVYESLRADIVEWRLAPGTVLAEVEQSERLGVSRTPVREALGRLVADGLAVAQRGRGTVVSEVSEDHVEDLFVLRVALECASARQAASSAQRASFDELAQRFEAAALEIEIPGSRESYYQLVQLLDDSIDEAANNKYLSNALRTLRVHLQRIRRMAKDNPQRLKASAGEHAAIARAIASGNPEVAAAATTVHLHQSFTHIMAHAAGSERQ